jgi:putative ABC transport system substrate-binding protein
MKCRCQQSSRLRQSRDFQLTALQLGRSVRSDSVIDRRTFIGTLAGGLLASPFIVLAQQTSQLPRIGVLGNDSQAAGVEVFRTALRELGYVDGRTVVMEWRWAEGRNDRLPALAIELVQSKVDVIVVSSTAGLRAVMQATRTIPIVSVGAAYHAVESLARPGGQVTGLVNVQLELHGKRYEILREIVPKVLHVAVLWDPTNPIEVIGLQNNLAAAAAVGLKVQPIEVRTPDDYPAAFATITASRAEALYPFVNPVNGKFRALIADFALRNRLPSVCSERSFVEAGGLFSYAPDVFDLLRRGATYVDKILKGAKPADLPVQQPTKFELVINLKTAKALDITIPQLLLLRADEVIQ